MIERIADDIIRKHPDLGCRFFDNRAHIFHVTQRTPDADIILNRSWLGITAKLTYLDEEFVIPLWEGFYRADAAAKSISTQIQRFSDNPIRYLLDYQSVYMNIDLDNYFLAKLENSSRSEFLDLLGKTWFEAIRMGVDNLFNRRVRNLIRIGKKVGVSQKEIDSLYERIDQNVKALEILVR